MGLVPFGMLEIVFLVSLESHQHTMKDGWKVIRKEFSVGFQFPSYGTRTQQKSVS
jgi:hypothetical protein